MIMNVSKRLYLVAGLVAVLAIAFSAVTLTSRLTSAQSPDPSPAVEDADGDDIQDPILNGSIAVDEAQSEGLSEADEAAALAPLATISESEAVAAAQAEVPGTVAEVELGNENGSLVYEVKIGSQEVKVDAGNGAVLHIGADD